MSKFKDFSMDSAEEDDDFVAGLVEQMAHSMLDEGDEEEKWLPISSERRSWSSTNTSPSPAVSPPTPLHHLQYEAQHDAWELLHMAAQEVMRLKMGTTTAPSPHIRSSAYRQVEISPAVYSDVQPARQVCPPAFGQHEWKQRSTSQRHPTCFQNQVANQGIAWNRRRIFQQQQLIQQQVRQMANRNLQHPTGLANLQHPTGGNPPHRPTPMHPVACSPTASTAGMHPVGCSSTGTNSHHWNSINAVNSSVNGTGMRAVFLRGPGFGSSTSNGTGVFLPQAANNAREPKRKPSCSTVLLPSRIVEVLNLNVDELQCQPHSVQPANLVQGGGDGDEYLSAHLSKSYSACSPTRWHHSAAEHALPTEWTY